LTSYNVRSFHAYEQYLFSAKFNKATNARSLAAMADIQLYQETRFNPLEDRYLRDLLSPGSLDFYSNLSARIGGVATVVGPRVLSSHKPEVIPLPTSLAGRVLALSFSPKGEGEYFTVVNVHLDHSSHTNRERQLKLIREHVPPTTHLYFAGDLNFVENHRKDTTARGAAPLPAGFLGTWTDFLTHFCLKEVVQKVHTFLRGTEVPLSSRLDRIYISHPEVDWALAPPYAFIAPVPHTFLHSIHTDSRLPSSPDLGSPGTLVSPHSDHLPVALAFRLPLPDLPASPDPPIPKWVAEDPAFAILFEASWFLGAPANVDLSPFELLATFKLTLREAAGGVLARIKRLKKEHHSELAELMTLVKALRLLDTPPSRAHSSFYSRHPDMADMTSASLRGRFAALLSDGGVEPKARAPGKGARSPPPPPLERIKLYLPSTRARLLGP
jgi:endonuclease/exonuclease/phosphatase family metal-dependent hydrolase